jgi:hypothetical protein
MRAVVAIGLILLGLVPAVATDRASRPAVIDPPLPVPVLPHRNPQAQAVAAARECFRACQMQCKAELLACGYQLPGAECLARTDRCDRDCQRQCRSTGDPIIDWPRIWD